VIECIYYIKSRQAACPKWVYIKTALIAYDYDIAPSYSTLSCWLFWNIFLKELCHYYWNPLILLRRLIGRISAEFLLNIYAFVSVQGLSCLLRLFLCHIRILQVIQQLLFFMVDHTQFTHQVIQNPWLFFFRRDIIFLSWITGKLSR